MTAVTTKHIEDAAAAFVVSSQSHERRYRRLADYLLLLQLNGWPQADVEDVQSRVLVAWAATRDVA